MQEEDVNSRKKKKWLHRCEICNKYCKSEFCLKIHNRCHKKCKTGLYRCSLCHLTFTKQYCLNSHFNCAHSKHRLFKRVPGRSTSGPCCMCCRQKFSSLYDLKKHLKPTLFQFPSSSKWPTKTQVENGNHNELIKNIPSTRSNRSAPALNTCDKNICKSDEVSPMKVLIVPMERIDGKLPPQGGKKKLSTILPRPNGVERSLGTKKLPTIAPHPNAVKLSVGGQMITKLSASSEQNMSRKEDKRNSVNQDQNHQSTSAYDFDLDMGDGEFISVLKAAFKEDYTSDEDSNSSEQSLSNDDPCAEGKDNLNEDEASRGVSDPLEDEKMRQFLFIHSSVDTVYGVFKCLPCRSAFSSDAKLLDHFNCHLCHICGIIFEEKQELLEHVQNHKSGHKTVILKFDPSFLKNMFEKFADISDDGKRYTCTLCPEDFSQRSSLFIHMYSHARKLPDRSPKSNKRRKKSDNDKRSSNSREKTFQCPQCNKSFFSRNNLRGHMETHEQTHKYLCSICGKGFRRKRGMYKHLEVHAKIEENKLNDIPEQKEIVKKIIPKQIKLATKVKDAPVPEGLYKKQLLSNSGQFVVAACFTPDKLIPDQKPAVEMRERIYPCTICNKPFYTKANLRGHMEVHKAKKYGCPVCNQTFRRKLTMERHAATHTR